MPSEAGEGCLDERRYATDAQRFRLYLRHQGKCYACRRTLAQFHCDHLIPWSKGGKTDLGNLALICHSCNYSKCNRPLSVAWLARRMATNPELPRDRIQAMALARYVTLMRQLDNNPEA